MLIPTGQRRTLPHESDVRSYGDTVVATGCLSQSGTYQGRDVTGQFRGTQVFVRQDGQWRLAGLHLSPLAQGT